MRIIPMRVGTRFVKPQPRLERQDHPHACGDKLRSCLMIAGIRGSSPCVWGQGPHLFYRSGRQRIIPMRVGTRQALLFLSMTMRDHPHACGDKACVFFKDEVMGGSSPCVWGQVLSLLGLQYITRIIPMRVGTRLACLAYEQRG